jgi:dTMP kinase
VLFLDLDAKEAEKRGAYGEEKYEKREMQQRVRQFFASLSEENLYQEESYDLVMIDAGDSIEGLANTIWVKVLEDVKAVEAGSRGELGVVGAQYK